MNPADPLGRALIAAGAALPARSGDPDRLLADLPFLTGYLDADVRCPTVPPGPDHPLSRLAASGLSPLACEMLLSVGLAEEDPRFLNVLGLGGDRPTFGQLETFFVSGGDSRQALLDLTEAALVDCPDRTSPRPLWPLVVPSVIWDALAGRTPRTAGLELARATDAPPMSGCLVPAELRPALNALPGRLASGGLLTIRGAEGTGRRTLAAAVARELGFGLLRLAPEWCESAERWALAGALATLTGAMPMIALDLAPGEERTIPPAGLWRGPVAVVVGRAGAVRPGYAQPVLPVTLSRPHRDLRLRHWQAACPAAPEAALAPLADIFRVTGGAIRDAAATCQGTVPDHAAVREALRARAAVRLETVATRPGRPAQPLLLAPETRADFDHLALRCRNAERLADAADGSLGVRALLAGPSGTGKTLAARVLAELLGRDLWRIDLSSVVSKWIGETERNLERAFSAAEDHDALLLLDEGDALLARRTDVGSATDRYANLETSYLLQRMEAFDGVLLVTTNALDRIDTAFARRMDMVIRFPQPDAGVRHAILVQHLGSGAASDDLLGEVALRCTLSGGQLRNIALTARVEALATGGPPGDRELRAAVAQEYRKANVPCPLKLLGVAGP